MDSLKQQAQDYALGTLPKDDAILFEALLEKDEDARRHLIEAQEDFANLSMLAPLSDAGENLRSRVLESCQPKKISILFWIPTKSIVCATIIRLGRQVHRRRRFSRPERRRQSKTQDNLFRAYESLIDLFPLVSGDSAAASGDMGSLGDWIGNGAGNGTLLNSSLDDSLRLSVTEQHGDPVSRSTQRSLLAALPSLTFFINRVREKSATLADARRIFYLCRDQLKIMRASFADLDPTRLADDEKLRVHGPVFSAPSGGGPSIPTFPEMEASDADIFSTARSQSVASNSPNTIPTFIVWPTCSLPEPETGSFTSNCSKMQSPGECLRWRWPRPLRTRTTKSKTSSRVRKRTKKSHPGISALWKLIEESMLRGHPTLDSATIPDNPHHGCSRFENGTYLWFAWPNVANAQDGADAETENPLQ